MQNDLPVPGEQHTNFRVGRGGTKRSRMKRQHKERTQAKINNTNVELKTNMLNRKKQFRAVEKTKQQIKTADRVVETWTQHHHNVQIITEPLVLMTRGQQAYHY